MTFRRINPKFAAVAVSILAILIAGVSLAVWATARSSDGPEPAADEYTRCVEEAADYLHSSVQIPMEQARQQASVSPKCGPLAPTPISVPTEQSVEERLRPPGTPDSLYEGLYASICRSIGRDVPRYQVLQALEENDYTSEEAEFLYTDASKGC